MEETITKKELQEIYNTMTLQEALKRLGVSQGTYYTLLKKHGIKIKQYKKIKVVE